MDKKLPKVFANKIDKKINNNETCFNSNGHSKQDLPYANINEKIRNLFNSPSYIYRINVNIKLKDKEITKKIIGKNNNNLITIDNELIPISDIVDIELKKD